MRTFWIGCRYLLTLSLIAGLVGCGGIEGELEPSIEIEGDVQPLSSNCIGCHLAPGGPGPIRLRGEQQASASESPAGASETAGSSSSNCPRIKRFCVELYCESMFFNQIQ